MIVPGVANAIVAKTEQTGGVGRVLVTFPWLPASHPGTWARVASPLSGASTGQWFMPEVNDEVLVAFDRGDFDHPYVVGALWNGQDVTPETNPQLRVIVTPGGHQLRFEDVDGAKQVVLRTEGNQQLVLSDSASGTKAHLTTNGGCELLIDDAGTIRARTAGGLSLALEDSAQRVVLSGGGRSLTLQGAQVRVT
jgi:uncharacterized protein involved in type VI secretion and phage assembly